eukprot:1378806-Amorphochlora_amoeboformis.AAC.1
MLAANSDVAPWIITLFAATSLLTRTNTSPHAPNHITSFPPPGESGHQCHMWGCWGYPLGGEGRARRLGQAIRRRRMRGIHGLQGGGKAGGKGGGSGLSQGGQKRGRKGVEFDAE